jgi:hypothetical protein
VRIFWILAMVVGLSACGQDIDVTTFHALSGSLADKTFATVPSEKQQSSLEWKAYADMVASRLEAKGLRRVPPEGIFDYGVFVFYFIDSGTTSVSAMPVHGQTSAGTTTTTTSYVGRTPVQQTTYTPPTYGITGYYPVSTTTFGKGLSISIMDIRQSVAERKPVTVYEAQAKSVGSSNALTEVIPAMVAAVFQDWPGKSGSTRRVEVRLQE